MRRALRWGLAVVAAFVLLVALALLIVPRTDWARRQVRTTIEDAVEGAVDGSVRIGAIRGDLLREAVLEDVVIRDPDGEPVIEIPRAEVRYALRPLLRQRIRITGLELVEPRVVLEQDRAGRWNVAEAFAGEGEPTVPDTADGRGFGSWMRVDEMTIRSARVIVRTPWTPEPDDEDPGRLRVERVDGELVVVREVRDLDLEARDLVLTDPEAPLSGRLASLTGTFFPFHPPPLDVRHLEGSVELGEDSVRIRDLALELPGSRIAGSGALATESGGLSASIRVERLATADLAWLDPELPREGVASFDAGFRRGDDGAFEVSASDLRASVGGARLSGRAALRLDDGPRPGEVDLRFEGIDGASLREVAGVEVPLRGAVRGSVRIRPVAGGFASRADVEATLEHEGPAGGRSSLRITGPVDLVERAAGGVRVALDPLRVEALEPLAGELPVGGEIRGEVVVRGSPDSAASASLDLEHRGVAGRTRIAGTVEVGSPERDRLLRARLRLPVVALGTVGAFAPDAGLHGTARGSVGVEGPLSRLVLDVDLAVDGGGALALSGEVDAEEPGRSYDLLAAFNGFDAAAATTRAPATALDGTLAVRGEGIDPATLEAEVTADLRDTAAAGGVPAPRALRLEAALREGLLRVESGAFEVGSALAEMEGSFGVVEGRRGSLEVRVTADSLAAFADLAGSARVAATIEGGVDRIDVRGEARAERLVAAGARAARLRIRIEGDDVGAARPALAAEVEADSLRIAGLAYERLEAEVDHSGAMDDAEGSATVALIQDPGRDYRARLGYLLEADARELRVRELALRFDTATWVSTGPGTVRWAGAGVAVDSLELRSDVGGRIFVDGRFGGEGPAPGPDDRLVLEVEDLAISQIMGLLQDTVDASGRLGLRLRAVGPAERVRAVGRLTLDEPVYGETELPAVLAEGEYEPGRLEGVLRLLAREGGFGGAPGDTVLVASGSAAVDLFGAGIDPSGAIDLTVRADSLPLEGLPRFTDAVSDVRGLLRADVAIGGTLDDPEVSGGASLDLGRLDVEWPNLRLRDAVGAFHVEGETVVLDSLRARSGGGLLRLAGSADLSDGGRPRIDLAMLASDAQVLDNEIGRDVRMDGEVRVEGPYDALRVGGEVRLREGVFYVPEGGGDVIDLDDPLPRLALAEMDVEAEAVMSENPVLQGLRVEVELFVSPNTWLRLDDGTVEVRTPQDGQPLQVRYDRSEGRLVLEGSVNADRGEYEFAGRRFELRSGTATFMATQTVDPLLDLTAIHEVPRPGREALTIQIHVSGSLQDPRVVLTSNANPPLSQTDLISYLVFGGASGSLLQPGSSALTGGGGDDLGALATQQLASLALGAVLDEAFASVERSAADQGLDVVRIEPAELPDELAFQGYLENVLRGTQIEAGTYVTSRLFIGARGRATTEVWPGITAEYRGVGGFRWTGMWEPRYLPGAPAFDPELRATPARVLGAFLFWESRPGAGTGAIAPEPVEETDPVGGAP